jgi:hypothetical protein
LALGEARFDELDILRDWRNRKYRAGFTVEDSELEEALEWVVAFLSDVARWYEEHHRELLRRGLAR